MTFSRNLKLRKQENQMEQTLCKIARFRKINIIEHYVFSVSLTGIVRSPHFKRWIRVCINKLLVCFLIHNFVIWCIFLFPIFSFCIKVAGAQTSCSWGNRPLVTSLEQPKTIFEFGLPSIIAYSWKNMRVPHPDHPCRQFLQDSFTL